MEGFTAAVVVSACVMLPGVLAILAGWTMPDRIDPKEEAAMREFVRERLQAEGRE
jgi:hypothetical protein